MHNRAIEFCNSLVPLLLGTTSAEFIANMDESKITTIENFFSDANCNIIFFSASRSGKLNSLTSEKFMVEVHADPSSCLNVNSHVVLMKRRPGSAINIEIDNIADSLNILNIPEGSIMESLHNYLKNAVHPIFDLASSKLNAQDVETKIPQAKRKFLELEMSLLSFQQNVDIPEVHLSVDEFVKSILANEKKLNFDEISADTALLNRLQAGVNEWVKEIQKVTVLCKEFEFRGIVPEVTFWLSLEKSLLQIDDLLKSPEIVSTIDILKGAKRFHATVSFLADTGVKESLDIVGKYNLLFKEFPLSKFTSPTDINCLFEGALEIFLHLNKRLKLSPYPIKRAVSFVEEITRIVNNELINFLQKTALISMDMNEFNALMLNLDASFELLDENIKEFINIARDISRKRNDKFIPIKVQYNYSKLQERLDYIKLFKKQHYQLQQTLSKKSSNIKSSFDENLLRDLKSAFNELKSLDPLDFSDQGLSLWVQAESIYSDSVSSIENKIIQHLRSLLSESKTFSEMYRVFANYNNLFVRPKIRGAIQEYQIQLISVVKADIDNLHSKFTSNYGKSQAFKVSSMRNMPPVSGAILWAKEIDKQLEMYLSRIHNILGDGWEMNTEGNKLFTEILSFRKKLEGKNVFDQWVQTKSKSLSNITGDLFKIAIDPKSSRRQLILNFDASLEEFHREVKNLSWMGFLIPHTFLSVDKEYRRIQPFYNALKEILRTYSFVVETIEKKPKLWELLISFVNSFYAQLEQGCQLKWEFFLHVSEQRFSADPSSNRSLRFIHDLNKAIQDLEQKTNLVLSVEEDISSLIESINDFTLHEDAAKYYEVLQKIQKNVDNLVLEEFENMHIYVAHVNSSLETLLLSQLKKSFDQFFALFEAKNLVQGSVVFYQEIVLRGQNIVAEPSLESAFAHWYKEFYCRVNYILELPIIVNSRYDLVQNPSQINTFGYLINSPQLSLVALFEKMKSICKVSLDFINNFYQFQFLWNSSPSELVDSLGTDIKVWESTLQSLTRIKDSQKLLSFSQSVIKIDAHGIVKAIKQKSQRFLDDIMAAIGEKFIIMKRQFINDVFGARNELETLSNDFDVIQNVLRLINVTFSAKKKHSEFLKVYEKYEQCERLLEINRFKYPSNWIYQEQVKSEWLAFNSILDRRKELIHSKLAFLQSKINAEETSLQELVSQCIKNWDENKPTRGDLSPKEALNRLIVFETELSKIHARAMDLQLAQKSLLLNAIVFDKLELVIEEAKDVSKCWNEVMHVWTVFDLIKQQNWSSLQIKVLKSGIEDVTNQMKSLPPTARQYPAVEFLIDSIKLVSSLIPSFNDLKSDAFKERHWRKLWRLCCESKPFSLTSLTLQEVIAMDLKKNESHLKEMLHVARGELGLEDYLNEIKSFCEVSFLELTDYSGNKVVRNWEFIASKLNELIDSIQMMKKSPFIKAFENEISNWDDRLTLMMSIFDNWMEVQKKWMYLSGVFSAQSDLKFILPHEFTKFQTLANDYANLIRKVMKNSAILEVTSIPGLEGSVIRMLDILEKIQKSLGEYLEKERNNFPRFYFLGDDDLLELLGKKDDCLALQVHIKKLYPGIEKLVFQNEFVSGVVSSEGEICNFNESINFGIDQKIDSRLAMLEKAMKACILEKTLEFLAIMNSGENVVDKISLYPYQSIELAFKIWFTCQVEFQLGSKSNLNSVAIRVQNIIESVSSFAASKDSNFLEKRKAECSLVELVRQRSIIECLVKFKVDSCSNYLWRSQLRFYHSDHIITVEMNNSAFEYCFEYFGLSDRLIYTPLTHRCLLTLTQALAMKLGGNPYGPAGTGKTETVKSLALHLGRPVLVFCCDESFDVESMNRILKGICQIGGFVCFDEFNRLDERTLSSVSQKIQDIQSSLKGSQRKDLVVSGNTGIFITMNLGYAGRNMLPDNLKKLFRCVSMAQPDMKLIAEVILFINGFKHATQLAEKAASFFSICSEQLSKQSHYDFGLRAIKAFLKACICSNLVDKKLEFEESFIANNIEKLIEPRLTVEDKMLSKKICSYVFGDSKRIFSNDENLLQTLKRICAQRNLEQNDELFEKAIQVSNSVLTNHGIILVGPVGAGKTTCLDILSKSLALVHEKEYCIYRISPKSFSSKEILFGKLDYLTREWSDGLFTHILRKINLDERGESLKNHWIIFDGDIDPEWIENLNSVLDDNKVLTLPNGERLNLPENCRIFFEVDSIKFATKATISRCALILFRESLINPLQMLLHGLEESLSVYDGAGSHLKVIKQIMESISIDSLIKMVKSIHHAMDFSLSRIMYIFKSSIIQSVVEVLHHFEHKFGSSDVIAEESYLSQFWNKKLCFVVAWSFAGDCPDLEGKSKFCDFLCQVFHIAPINIFDHDLDMTTSSWIPWASCVPILDLDTNRILDQDLIIPTVDTIKIENVVMKSLNSMKSALILCGPPGSGKTMSLFSVLNRLNDYTVATINFSSATSPENVLKVLELNCCYKKDSNGFRLESKIAGKKFALFCDEINLPKADKFGTVRVISFLRDILEFGGFWKVMNGVNCWIKTDNIKIIGACNPPTDPGRIPLPKRFLKMCQILWIGYPSEESLQHIYSTFSRSILKVTPSLLPLANNLSKAMIEVYVATQNHITVDMQPHYIYSPRELSRWIKGVFESILHLSNNDDISPENLASIWLHEGIRLFHDRIVEEELKVWTDDCLNRCAQKWLSVPANSPILNRPVLYSNWLSKDYKRVDKESIKAYLQARLRMFCEEELDAELIFFDHFIDHALRVDRVFKQPQGHILMIGSHGSGKSSLIKFVAWLNGISVVQLKMHSTYCLSDFDEDLKDVMRRSIDGEKVCFLLNENNMLDPGFTERMNTLLANGEVPGLFSDEEYLTCFSNISDVKSKETVISADIAEVKRWCLLRLLRNLHIAFTMKPSDKSLNEKLVASPALFNRCVIDWYGSWPETSLYQFAVNSLASLDLSVLSMSSDSAHSSELETLSKKIIEMYSNAFCIKDGYFPIHFINFIKFFKTCLAKRRSILEEEQLHKENGLAKMKETLDSVEIMKGQMASRKATLNSKSEEANKKLQIIIANQKVAEEQKQNQLKLQEKIEKKKIEINERKSIVVKELESVRPAVEEAQKSVCEIKKQHLTEIRSMNNPPEAVKMTIECICIVLGFPIDSWKNALLVLRKDDFIPSIVNFDTESSMNPQKRQKLLAYLQRDEFTFENVDRSSKACGPLYNWIKAQTEYSAILEKIGPLKEEVAFLETSSVELIEQAEVLTQSLAEAEKTINDSKIQYSNLLVDIDSMTKEIDQLESKVSRCLKILNGLEIEKGRWLNAMSDFRNALQNLVGNCLLESGIHTFFGCLDHESRIDLKEKWEHLMSISNISYDKSFTLPISTNQIDDFHKESYEILEQSIMYPLIVDPSLQIAELIKSQHPNLIQSSFLDESFSKHLESAIRFGNILLIHDSENINPVIFPVLKKEIQKIGGRQLIKLGRLEIDFNPTFRVLLCSKSAQNLKPHIFSLVNVVDFSVTKNSLVPYYFNACLKADKPESFEHLRSYRVLQGTLKNQLKGLEQKLLLELAGSQENLLENVSLMKLLEEIGMESASLKKELDSVSNLISSIDEVKSSYMPHIYFWISVYVSLEKTFLINPIYKISIEEYSSIIMDYLRTNCPGLLSKDFKSSMSLLLTKLIITLSKSYKSEDKLFMSVLSCLRMMKDEHDSILNQLCTSSCIQRDELSLKNSSFFKDLVRFVDSLLGQSLDSLLDFDLFESIISKQAENKPISLCSSAGYDPSVQLEIIAKTKSSLSVCSVAMGTRESLSAASEKFSQLSMKGGLLLLKNVHLVPDWFSKFFQKLSSLPLNQDFRLVYTIDMNYVNFPPWILLQSHRFILEPQPGIKGKVKSCLRLLDNLCSFDKLCCKEEEPILLSLCFLHAIILERLEYSPVGWTKKYEFSDIDFECAFNVIHQQLQGCSKSSLLESNSIWNSMQNILADVVYGGRLENDFDYNVLKNLVDHFLSPSILSSSSKFSFDLAGTVLFDIFSVQAKALSFTEKYSEFVSLQIPEVTNSAFVGISANFDSLIQSQNTKRFVDKMQVIRDALCKEENVFSIPEGSSVDKTKTVVINKIISLLSKLEGRKGPFGEGIIEEFLQAEFDFGMKLKDQIEKDSRDLLSIYEGKMKWTTDLQEIHSALIVRETIPIKWSIFYSEISTIEAWCEELVQRLCNLSNTNTLCLSLLFHPSGYFTASALQFASSCKTNISDLKPVLVKKGSLVKLSAHFIELRESSQSWNLIADTSLPISKVESYGLDWITDTVGYSVFPLYQYDSRSSLISKVYCKMDTSKDMNHFSLGCCFVAQ